MRRDMPAIVVNMLRTFRGAPSPKMEVAMKGPIAPPMNLDEFRSPNDAPFLPTSLQLG